MADPCVTKVIQAVGAEQQAIELDRRNETQAALAQYKAAERLLDEATNMAAEGEHAQDVEPLRKHREELLARMDHLGSLSPGESPSIPLEEQVHNVELAMRMPEAVNPAESSRSEPAAGNTVAGAAAVGAIGGVVLGGLLCAPILGAAAGAAGLGIAAGREGRVGDAARNAGGVATSAAAQVRDLDSRYEVSSTVAAKAQEVSTAVQGKAEQLGTAAHDVASKGRASRSAAPEDGYKFGDLTRGLVAEGKEARGGSATEGYRFGDFSRGLMTKLRGGNS